MSTKVSAAGHLIDLLDEGALPEQRYALVYTLFCTGNPEEAMAELADVPVQIDLDETGWVQYEDVSDFFGIMLDIHADNRTLFQISDTETAQLLSVVSEAVEPARTWAQNLLEMNGRGYFHEQILIPDELKSTVVEPQKYTTRKRSQSGSTLRVHPNPAQSFIVVDYSLNRSAIIQGYWRLTVRCLDTGRPLAVRSIESVSGQAVFDTRTFPRGAYLVVLTEEDQIIETATFVVQPR